MPVVHVIEETFIVADPESVRAVVCDPRGWAGWIPGIELTSYDDRGPLGVRWLVSGELAGTAEVWLEEHGDGTIVHAYIRADPTSGSRPLRRRSRGRRNERYTRALKQAMFDAKDRLEGAREPGSARVPLDERVVSASDGADIPGPRAQRPTSTGSEGAASDARPDHLEHPDRC